MKNKKFLGIMFATLILSMPTTFKISAMEKNQKNIEENSKTTKKNFNFSEDEYFDAVFEDHLKYVLTTTLVENLKEYLQCYAKNIKVWNTNSINKALLDELNNLPTKININFRKENKNFIENNIKLNKNMKVNFYYYEYLLNCLYDHLIFSAIDFLTYKFLDYVKKGNDYKIITDSIKEHSELIFKNISEFLKEKIHKTGNENFYNIPEKYGTFEKYLKENPEKPYEIEDMYCEENIPYFSGGENNLCNVINKTIPLNEIYNIVRNTLKEIFEMNETVEFKK